MDPVYHGSQAISQALSFRELIEHLRREHRESPANVERALMLQRTSSGTENAFLIWPAWQHDRNLGIKIVTLFPGNVSVPTVQALYALFDGSNGSIAALLDGTELTYWKTAADSALGADYLAHPDSETLLMVGAGNMAPFMIRAYSQVRPSLRRVLLWNRTAARAHQLARAMRDIVDVQVVDDLASAVAEAQIVCCATTSYQPIICGQWLRPGTHLDLIGGYTPQMREADDEAMRRGRVFVDSRWFTVEHVGDLTQPIANGTIKREDVLGDLFDLCTGKLTGRESDDEITVFKSGGGAHLDLMTAQYIAKALKPTG